jgi:hypothetical protein
MLPQTMESTLGNFTKRRTGDGLRLGDGSEGGGGKVLSRSTLGLGESFSLSRLAFRSSRSLALRLFSSWCLRLRAMRSL